MISFLFDSEALQAELRNSPHEAGEVAFLQSILRPGMSVIEPGANRGVTAVAIARQMSDRHERIRFYKHGAGSGITPEEAAEVLDVEAIAIMDFLTEQREDRIDFMNPDYEGSELLVLRGAQSVLEKHGPQVFCEIHHGYLHSLRQSANDIVGFLSDFGYRTKALEVEDLYAESSVAECSHIYAWRPRRAG